MPKLLHSFFGLFARRIGQCSAVPVFLFLLFFGALFWAKCQDPFSRLWFTLKTPGRVDLKCVVVLPKPIRRCPVIFYAHGSGDSLMDDGNDLRQLAELGLATVSLEYDQTNETAFATQFEALLQYITQQKWANTNAIAWVGSSLGANRMWDFALQHPDQQPQLLVQLSGGGVSIEQARSQIKLLRCPVLLVHGDQDAVFPVADIQRLVLTTHSNVVSMELRIVPNTTHSMGPNRALIFRCIGEYCLTHLSGSAIWQHYHSIAQWEAEAPPFWPFCIPAAAWVVTYFTLSRYGRQKPPKKTRPKWQEIAFRWLAVILALWALSETTLHLLPQHFTIDRKTLDIARRYLVQPKESSDFKFLAARPIWHNQKLKTILDHVELANYNRELINWRLDDKIYQNYVLSPVIAANTDEQLNWRRPLWEEFYPRIRHENSSKDAATMVVRHLRERVTIATIPDPSRDIPTIWLRQITDETGFQIIYVAALRPVGVPARLNPQQQTEFFDDGEWRIAPAPAVVNW